MQVILLERIEKLGQMGDVVTVKDGYARNFLLPQNKALRATDENKTRFESQKVHLVASNLERKSEADAVAEKLAGITCVLLRQASDTGQLYGSVNARDLAEAATEAGFKIDRKQVRLGATIKTIGLHPVAISLHPEVTVKIVANVARSTAEAETQEAGEAEPGDEAAADAEAFFETPELAAKAQAESDGEADADPVPEPVAEDSAADGTQDPPA
jgi:large subunit ribosomal protein L9